MLLIIKPICKLLSPLISLLINGSGMYHMNPTTIERYLGRKCTKEEVQEDIHTSLLKVQRMLNQARLGADLRRRHEGTILWENQSETEHVVSKNKKLQITISGRDQSTKHVVSKTKELQMDEKANIITLDDLKIFPKVGEQGGEAIVGTLEVHVNGFLCATSSPNFSFSFLYADVAKAFFRVEDEEMPPLLHFHLHDPIKLGTEKRQNIQLRLVMNPMGQKRSYDDSDKIKKDKQTRDRVHNKDLKNFVHNVQEKWDHIPSDEFQGNLPSKAPTIFGLTFSALVGLVDEPFVVVNLYEIEIVILRLKHVEIDMTIVFQDFKHLCNFAGVKYYEIFYDENWVSKVKEIADSPWTFAVNGGWRFLEGPETLNYYKHYDKEEMYTFLED
ncbi:hypothetical protein MKX01_009004 [Papaver californicum]|nr:hypothetical protein MKX01_009004 [Papaver californicum]